MLPLVIYPHYFSVMRVESGEQDRPQRHPKQMNTTRLPVLETGTLDKCAPRSFACTSLKTSPFLCVTQ